MNDFIFYLTLTTKVVISVWLLYFYGTGIFFIFYFFTACLCRTLRNVLFEFILVSFVFKKLVYDFLYKGLNLMWCYHQVKS